MPGPYDYTINIPQPPAQNFLQSLLGIQQLKGLQQQSQLAEQQAAIQQQQAQFAQELQPLERQKLEAAIAAQKAGAAQAASATDIARENLRQSKITFGREEALNKEADALRADMMKLSADPTSATREKLLDLSYRAAAYAPKSYEPLQKMLKDYPRTGKILENTASDVIFSVQSGQPAVASKSVELALKGAENTLQENPNDKDAQAALALLQPVQSLMQQEKYGEAMITASNFLRNIYPERWDAVTKDMKEMTGIAETQAKTKKELALATETKQQKQVDEEKRALDLEKEKLQIQEIQQKIDAGRSDKVKIYASQNKEGYKLNEEARNATLQAEKAKGILNTLESTQAELPKNLGQSILQYVRDKVPSWNNDVSFLRTQYSALLAPEAKKNLPPGSASDADMREARKGLLDRNATPAQFKKAVEVIAKLSEDQAKYAEAKLGWISENEGSIGTAVKDISVFGSTVKKGTPLNAWWNKVGKDLDLNKLPTESAPAPVYAPPAGITIKSVR